MFIVKNSFLCSSNLHALCCDVVGFWLTVVELGIEDLVRGRLEIYADGHGVRRYC